MVKVSIVTPVYNSEKYLHQCIDSVINQTFKDIELILIDDGSTDSSPLICDNYAKKYPWIKVIHKNNAGMGVSYNIGMDNAQGEYIGFLESDDFTDEKMFEKLYNLANENNKPDIIKSSWYMYYTATDSYTKDTQLDKLIKNKVFHPKDCPSVLKVQFSVWSAIYKTDFIRNKNIRYLETPGASYQDVDFTFKAFCSANSMLITPEAYLYYRQDNENSSVNSKEKSEVIFNEYKEVDNFFTNHSDIKTWANEYKLIKQFYDYEWNYKRIANHLKHNFIKRFAMDFKKYKNNNELTPFFYSNINSEFLNEIINLV